MSGIQYVENEFQEISRDQIMTYHRSRYANGIVKKGAKAATIQIVTSNEKGYTDAFTEDGDLLDYSRSNKKSDNLILDRLPTGSWIHVYIFGKDSKKYWSCGVYNIVENFTWGWKLKRIQKPSTREKRFSKSTYFPY